MLDKARENERNKVEIRARASTLAKAMANLEARTPAGAPAGADPVAALANETNDGILELTLSEALVIGLLKQGVRQYYAIFGHGSTDLGEVLRLYHEAGVLRVINCRNEVEMAHAATAHAWVYGETPAVVTSIGPGGLQAMAGSLAAASNGVGVYHIYGDETTCGEGYNMQQVPKPEQGLFGRIAALMGQSYTLHTPGALRDCLRRGTSCVHHPYKAGPFYVLLPINTQPQRTRVNIATLPARSALPPLAPTAAEGFAEAVALLHKYAKIVIKAGGGTRQHHQALRRFAQRIGAPVVLSPGASGVLQDGDVQNMHVGGSKGSISGNYAMHHAEAAIIIGSRGVCQADCSGVGYANAQAVLNINGDFDDLCHYANTIALPGDITAVLDGLLSALGTDTEADTGAHTGAVTRAGTGDDTGADTATATATNSDLDTGADAATNPDRKFATGTGLRAGWLRDCMAQKNAWTAFKAARTGAPPMYDDGWQRPVLTQPAAIQTVARFANQVGAIKFFDAGDVQANGFQIVEDDAPGQTYTETGASFMGFAASALLGAAGVENPKYAIAFTGDGSFMMNPQILIDAVEHGVRGMIALFDNRRMAAISGLQQAQYGQDFKTSDSVAVDYVAMAASVTGVKALHAGFTQQTLDAALRDGFAHDGLSLLHIPVYAGQAPIAGMGAWGAWNVGNWVDEVQAAYLTTKI